MKYHHIYTALKNLGFSPAKAAEIMLDAMRGDEHARAFVAIAYRLRH